MNVSQALMEKVIKFPLEKIEYHRSDNGYELVLLVEDKKRFIIKNQRALYQRDDITHYDKYDVTKYNVSTNVIFDIFHSSFKLKESDLIEEMDMIPYGKLGIGTMIITDHISRNVTSIICDYDDTYNFMTYKSVIITNGDVIISNVCHDFSYYGITETIKTLDPSDNETVIDTKVIHREFHKMKGSSYVVTKEFDEDQNLTSIILPKVDFHINEKRTFLAVPGLYGTFHMIIDSVNENIIIESTVRAKSLDTHGTRSLQCLRYYKIDRETILKLLFEEASIKYP